MSLKDTDVKTPGDETIAKKFKLSLAKVRQLVKVGAEHEKEHNTNLAKAKEVARDHIGERPDYYRMLKKAEKTKIRLKEESATGAVRGLGYVTGDPGVDPVSQYINSNAMSYEDENGNKLEYIKKAHVSLHNSNLGYNAFDPTKIGAAKNFSTIKENVLNELGSMMQDGMPGTTGLTDLPPKLRKNDSVDEGKKIDRAKKAVMAALTATNIYTLGDVAGKASEGRGSPKRDIVAAATTLPGAAGWGATGVHYAKKAYDYVKRKKMNEEKNDLKGACWKGYTAKGLKKKGGRMVPNCVPTEQKNVVPASSTARGIYEKFLQKEGWASIGHPFTKLGDPNPNAQFHGKRPKPTDTKKDEKDDTYKGSKQGGTNVNKVKPVREDWQKVNRKDKTDGLSQAAVNAYRREHPGSKLKTAVTEKNPSGKRAARRKSFCSRMSGMKAHLTSAKTARDPDSNINKALRRWNCHEEVQIDELKKATLASYIKKASDSRAKNQGDAEFYQKKGINNRNYKKYGKALNKVTNRRNGIRLAADKLAREEVEINELKAETLGSYTKKAAESRKKSLKGSNPDIKTWSKRQKGITTAIKKLTSEETKMVKTTNSNVGQEEGPYKVKDKNGKHIGGVHYHPKTKWSAWHKKDEDGGYDKIDSRKEAEKAVHSLHKEYMEESYDPVNEAIDNIFEGNLSEMKENITNALQEKTQEKLEERKKIIASQYFGQ
jgi:hypothetical protein